VASKLLGSFSIREKGVGGLRQFDGGHKLKSRHNKQDTQQNTLEVLLVIEKKKETRMQIETEFPNLLFFQHFFYF